MLSYADFFTIVDYIVLCVIGYFVYTIIVRNIYITFALTACIYVSGVCALQYIGAFFGIGDVIFHYGFTILT